MLGYLRQSTNSQAITLGPFISDSDFKTPATGLTIANTDIRLKVNGGADAPKNSGGATHDVNGEYDATFDATDTATVGRLKVSVVVTGALPFSDVAIVLEEAVYDALFAASAPGYVANAPVNVAQFGGSNGTFSGGRPEVNTTHAAGTAWGSGAITAAAIATGAIDADALAADAVQAIVDGVLDEPISGHTGTGSVGEAIDAAGAGSSPADIADAVWDEDLTVHTTPDSAGALLGAAGITDTGAIADKVLGRNLAGGSDGGRTVQDALRLLRNKASISAGTLTVTEEDDSTPAWTAAVTTAAGDPVTGVDPA